MRKKADAFLRLMTFTRKTVYSGAWRISADHHQRDCASKESKNIQSDMTHEKKKCLRFSMYQNFNVYLHNSYKYVICIKNFFL